MCLIRTEISTYKHLGKYINLSFVWLAVICFRQNYFYILPDFGDYFGAKMSFFSLYNQPTTKLFYKTLSLVYQEAADIRYVYLYKMLSVQVGLRTPGERCSLDKKSEGCRLTTHKIRDSQWKITSIVHFLIKAWNFAKWWFNDLTNDIRYNAKLNRSKICYFWVK